MFTWLSRRALLMLLALAVPFTARAQGSTTWYLAEGATGSYFEEDILIGNPNAAAADIRITYLKPDRTTVVQQFTMAPTSRRTVRVNSVAGLENTSVSAVVQSTNSLAIVVERTMYFPDGRKAGGHNANGVTSTATKWLFAEGATGFFDTFILVANPDPVTAAAVRFTFLKEDGTTVVQTDTVQPASRYTLWVNRSVPGLSAAAFSVVVETTNGVGVIAERAMYFRGFEAGHDSVGVTAPALSWRFAEGFTGSGFAGTLGFETYLLLGNPGTTPANVTVTYFKEAGAPVVRSHTLAPTSRLSIYTNAVPGLANSAFSALVESTNNVPIVAERSVYFGQGGAWSETHNTPGLTGDAEKWAFAEGVEDGALNATTQSTPAVYTDSFYLVSNSTPNALALRATFMREDGTGIVRTFTVAERSRFTLITGAFPELSNQKFATFLESTNGVPFAAERTIYWGSANGRVWSAGHGSAGTPWTGPIAGPPAPPAPTLTAVSPASGPTGGGTEVTLTGSNFDAAASVSIGGVAATNVRVINATTIKAVTPPRAAGTVAVVVTANNRVLTLNGAFTFVAPVNLPPVIQSITLNSPRVEAGGQLLITAVVSDPDTPLDRLSYRWSAAPVNGSFSGETEQVTWTAPAQQTTPNIYTLTLTVVDDANTVSSSVQVRYNDSVNEVTGLVLQFLSDFSNYSVSPERCVRNFSDSCIGKQEELNDITNNRALYQILGGEFRVSRVTFSGGRTRADITAPCTFRSIVKATGELEIAAGTCLLTAVYENWIWRLCDSYFTSPSSALPRPFSHP